MQNRLSVLDIIALNKIIFGKFNENYGKEYQKYNPYNKKCDHRNIKVWAKTQIKQYTFSSTLRRNTVTRWKKNLT